MASSPVPLRRARPLSRSNTPAGSSAGHSAHPHSRQPSPHSPSQRPTSPIHEDEDVDVDSQDFSDFSDTSSNVEGVFAFCPPNTVEQRIAPEYLHNGEQLLKSLHYHSPHHSEDAHTLVETPVPLAATLAGPSRLTSQDAVDACIGKDRVVEQHTAVPPHPRSDTYLSRPSSRVGQRETNVNVGNLLDAVIVKEKQIAKSVLTEASESVIGFEFDDTESRDGSKECDINIVWTDPAENSLYPEVRASVSNVDEPSMPVLTFRMWTIGLTLCVLSAGLNTFFNFRFPAPSIAPLVLLLISYPIGKLAAHVLPITKYRLPFWLGSHEVSFNPGPWNIKEHVCVFLMANVSVNPAYAMNTIVVSERFYNVRLGFGFNLTLVLATQLTGFGIAGLARRFLVRPASMVWPQNLVACTLLNTLHAEEDNQSGGITRYKFFMITAVAAFVYYFLPGFLFQALSMFSYVCWMAPNNLILNQLFGVRSGLGFGILTFDWSQISFIGSPLMVPWWAQAHVMIGFILFYWIVAPLLYYNNIWKLAHLPMASNEPFDNTGNPYNITRVMTAEHNTFNITAYDEYSPLYLPATYVITYLLAFALSTCVIVHAFLYHGRAVVDGIIGERVEEDDVHAKLMRKYPEVPDWWYATCLAFFFSMAILAVQVWPTETPVWTLVLAVLLPVIYILPSGFIYAVTGQAVSLNLLGEIIPGTLLPGNPLANMIFKAYSVQSLSEALSFVQDLKLGHYIKTPPRASFIVQLVATILAGFVQVGVKEWLFANIHDLCSPTQKDMLTCPHNQVYFTASAVWGLIGPRRQFGRHSIYGPELYALLFGAFIPVPFWLWRRRYSNSRLPHINIPVLLNGSSFIPPATGINYSSWFAVGFVFQYAIRTRHFAWWSKFNYVLSAALDSGTIMSICAVFLFLQLPAGGVTFNWIGNTIFTRTADWKVLPLIAPSVPPEPF